MKGGIWIISEEHTDLIYEIYTKYRNGGVHEHIISFEVCEEALNRLLLDEDSQLRNLLGATAPLSNH